MTSNVVLRDTETMSSTTAWFRSAISLDEIPKPALELLMQYTSLAPDAIVSHLNTVRNNAWKSAPYPCVGLFLFLELQMSRHPLYPAILSHLSSTEEDYYLLDVGCGLGQDLRKLRYDGAQIERTYAVDFEQGLIDNGFDLFMDSNQSKDSFIAGDALKDNPSQWLKTFGIEDGFNTIHVGSLLHLFDWNDQLLIVKNLISLTRRRENPVIFGWQYAARKSGLVSLGPNKEAQIYGHNEDSLKQFWKEVGELTGTEWSLQVRCEWAQSHNGDGLAKDGKWGDAGGNGLMRFSVHGSEGLRAWKC